MHDHKFNPAKAEKLLSPERYHEIKPDILLQKLGIAPGSVLMDLGCGNGFFTFPAAAGMGEKGHIIAADMSEHMLDLLRRRSPPDTVQILKTEEVKLDIDDDSVDATVAINLYHEFKYPAANLDEIARVTRSGGRLLILDWNPEGELLRGPEQEIRVARETVAQHLTTAGFKVESDEDYTADHWLIIATRE
jgi:ubiquinone/menaquinone biosynthesis C-methylase UbiE